MLSAKQWFDQNQLTVNVGKTKCMAVSLRAAGDPVGFELKLHTCGGVANCLCESIDRVTSYKYLGVMLDNRLSWAPHAKYVNNKLRKCIFMFNSLSNVLDKAQLKTVYHAYVQSILQYGIISWGGAYTTIIRPLNITQKLIIKSALKKPIRYPSHLVFQDFPVLDTRQLFIKALSCYAFKHDFDFLEKYDHLYPTRRQTNISNPRISKSVCTTNSYYIAHVIYGRLPVEFRAPGSCSLTTYGKKIVQWLLTIGREKSGEIMVSDYVL